jgi:hypothetical protein
MDLFIGILAGETLEESKGCTFGKLSSKPTGDDRRHPSDPNAQSEKLKRRDTVRQSRNPTSLDQGRKMNRG